MKYAIAVAGGACLAGTLALGSVASAVAGTPRPAPKAAAPRALANGSFTATLDGFAIHYEVHGRGPVLMTLPNSWGLTLDGLRGLYRALEKRLTLVYFDPRGMGKSGAIKEPADMGMAAVRADFHALRRRLGLAQVGVIGWSNGAMNLIHLASQQPDSFSAAIFLHGSARFVEEDGKALGERYGELFRQFGAFREEMRASDLPESAKDARVKAFDRDVWFPYLFADRESGRAKLRELYRDAGFSWRHAEYSQQEGAGAFDWRDELAKITARSLVIAGRHDMLTVERAEELHRGIAGSTFVVFEGSGHFAPIEEPARFESTVLDFLGVKAN